MLAVRVVVALFAISCVVAFPVSIKPIQEIAPHLFGRNVQADPICFPFTCANLGQTCQASLTPPITIPICLGTWCDNEGDYKCHAYLNDGQNCTLTNYGQCKTTSFCNYQGDPNIGVCTADKSDAGGKCQTATDCNYDFPCSGGVCQGKTAGQSCSTGSQCNPPLMCDGTTCVVPTAAGASCDPAKDLCDQLHYCAPTTAGGSATCLSYGTAGVGSPCTSDEQCPDNTACYQDPSTTGPVGTCTTIGTSSSLISCSNDTVCRQFETCQCNSGNGQNQCILNYIVNPSGTRSELQNLFSCANDNCASNPTVECITSKCNSQYCAYTTTVYEGQYAIYAQTYPACFANYFKSQIYELTGCTAPTTSPASTITSSLASWFVVLAFALVCCCL